MINPDYPTNTGSFLSHTYQPQPQFQNNTFYYGGMGSMPGTFQQDSRRNEPMMNPTQPAQPNNWNDQMAAFQALYAKNNGCSMPQQPQYQQYPTSPISVPVEQNIQPFSSYPPEYQAPTNPFGMNVQTDSRRFDPNAPQSTSPWTQTTPSAPAYSTPNPFVQNQFPNTVPTMDCSAMYTQCNVTPITRKTQQWENTYTQPNPSQLPVANWTQYIPNPQQASGPVYPTPAPPAVPSVTPDTSWESIAKQNFPNK